MTEQQPSVGRTVHYVSRGSADGAYASECRAAIITAVEPSEGDGSLANMRGPEPVSLAVLNPEGMFFKQGCRHSEGAQTGGTWHWPERV
ncbi:hypothetical protein [Streptomyces sp. CA-111067]|uniref:hypothetical protein n=1 Tax=Streptomyces sp. CA-111067 TaxID=3240046 RepID=UPI003D962A8B